MNRRKVMDGHCDTVYRCWSMGEELPYNTGALELSSALDTFESYAQIFALWSAKGYVGGECLEATCKCQLGYFRRQMECYSHMVTQCTTAQQARHANEMGRCAAFLWVEGAELLGCSLKGLAWAAREGVCGVNLTWNHENALSGSHCENPQQGLTALGRQFVLRMQELEMLVDVSHLSEAGFWDVMELCPRGVVASHSNARAICNHTRNLTDEQITAIIEHQGIIGLNFYENFVGGGRGVEDVRRHLDHMLDLGGARYVALGGDWDGAQLIPALSHITKLEDLWEYLLAHGYEEKVLQDLFYNNLMGVVRQL